MIAQQLLAKAASSQEPVVKPSLSQQDTQDNKKTSKTVIKKKKQKKTSKTVTKKCKATPIAATSTTDVGDQNKKRAVSRKSSQKHRLHEKELLTETHTKKARLEHENEQLRQDNASLEQQVRLIELMTSQGKVVATPVAAEVSATPAAAMVASTPVLRTPAPPKPVAPAFTNTNNDVASSCKAVAATILKQRQELRELTLLFEMKKTLERQQASATASRGLYSVSPPATSFQPLPPKLDTAAPISSPNTTIAVTGGGLGCGSAGPAAPRRTSNPLVSAAMLAGLSDGQLVTLLAAEHQQQHARP